MANATLYTYANSFRANKALIAAQYSGTKIDVAKDFSLGATNKTDQFLSKFPLGKVPALELKGGETLFESNAIAFYAANEQLRGKSALEQAQVIQWLSFADNEIVPAALGWVLPTLSIVNLPKQQIERSQKDLQRNLAVLNNVLLSRTFLVGERVTLADIVLACSLELPYQHVLDPTARSAYPNVNRWFTTLINQPQFKKVLGDVKLCEKVGAAGDALSHARGNKSAEKQQKKEKPKKEEKKKPEPKPKEPEPEEEPEDDFSDKPSKDPFEVFPKGTFNLENWKRFYSNNEDAQSLEYFWQNFDKENYSIWFCEYKYPEDLSMVFMTCNLMGGMFQRLDKMRKNSFGNLLCWGDDKKNTITGLWVWRSHELAFTLSDDWNTDYESYEWRKLEPDADETKAIVKQYLAMEGDYKGLPFNQGKCFK